MNDTAPPHRSGIGTWSPDAVNFVASHAWLPRRHRARPSTALDDGLNESSAGGARQSSSVRTLRMASSPAAEALSPLPAAEALSPLPAAEALSPLPAAEAMPAEAKGSRAPMLRAWHHADFPEARLRAAKRGRSV